MFKKIINPLGNNFVSLFTYHKYSEEYLVIVLKKANYKQLNEIKKEIKNHNLIIMTEKDFSEGLARAAYIAAVNPAGPEPIIITSRIFPPYSFNFYLNMTFC